MKEYDGVARPPTSATNCEDIKQTLPSPYAAAALRLRWRVTADIGMLRMNRRYYSILCRSPAYRICDLAASDGVETFFSETETMAKTKVSRHETSQDISDLVKTRRDYNRVKMFQTWDTAETHKTWDEPKQFNIDVKSIIYRKWVKS